DRHFEDLAVLRAGEGLEGQPTARATLLVLGQIEDFLYGGQVGVITALRPRLARLLAARLLRGVVGGVQGFISCGPGFALFPEELLLAKAKFGLQFGVALLQLGDAQLGLVVQRLPVGGATEGLESFSQVRTNRAGAVLGLGSGTSERTQGGLDWQRQSSRTFRPGGRASIRWHTSFVAFLFLLAILPTGLPNAYFFRDVSPFLFLTYQSRLRDSNPGPMLYESIALPAELRRQPFHTAFYAPPERLAT